jgi:superfamily I DNA and/or RNA helicase
VSIGERFLYATFSYKYSANLVFLLLGQSSPLYKNGVSLLNGDAYVFLQVTGVERQTFGGSYCNTAEAEAVLELVKKLRAASDATEWYSVEKIRIITFYQAQVSLIKRLLSENGLGQIVVATVDSSQGCEADIVIVSFVRSHDACRGGNHSAGFLSDDRRLNVALTRAKYQLVCVGNARGLQSISGASTLQSLALDAHERKSVISEEALGLDHEKKAIVEDAKMNERSSNMGSRKRPKTM